MCYENGEARDFELDKIEPQYAEIGSDCYMHP